jgi:hypothetical protein
MRKIKAYGPYYKEFFDSQSKGVQEKILYGLLKLKNEKNSIIKVRKSN